MWEILICKWFLLLKFQINSKRPGFWKEKSVENVVTLECSPQFNGSMISFHIWVFKKGINTLQNNVSHVEFPYFVMGSQLGPMAEATLVFLEDQTQNQILYSIYVCNHNWN
jgi:hypothetical protein